MISGGEEKAPEGDIDADKAEKITKAETSNPVAIIRFTPTTTKREC
jgi:hypothetical protein